MYCRWYAYRWLQFAYIGKLWQILGSALALLSLQVIHCLSLLVKACRRDGRMQKRSAEIWYELPSACLSASARLPIHIYLRIPPTTHPPSILPPTTAKCAPPALTKMARALRLRKGALAY